MAEQRPKLIGIITGLKGKCGAGHKVGDRLELGLTNTGGLCGAFYHDVYPYLFMLYFGGTFHREPIILNCPDTTNVLSMELKRE